MREEEATKKFAIKCIETCIYDDLVNLPRMRTIRSYYGRYILKTLDRLYSYSKISNTYLGPHKDSATACYATT